MRNRAGEDKDEDEERGTRLRRRHRRTGGARRRVQPEGRTEKERRRKDW